MITGLRPATFENLQLNAGIFLENFNYSSIANAGALKTALETAISAGTTILGATIGDGTFVCTPSIRQIEANGMRYPIKGSTVNDMWTVKMTGTMKEVNPANFKRAIPGATISGASPKTTIKVNTDIASSDYITSLVWVGDTSKGYCLIKLDNALNTSGATFTFKDKGEGSIPFEFQAHCASLSDMANAPCEIVFFENVTSGGGGMA